MGVGAGRQAQGAGRGGAGRGQGVVVMAPSYATTEVECGGGWAAAAAAAPTCHLTFKSTLVLRHIRRSLAHGLKIGCSIHTALEGRETAGDSLYSGCATLRLRGSHSGVLVLREQQEADDQASLAASVQCHIIKT